jgi:hypothetical protein
MMPEELAVGRRNLVTQLKAALDEQPTHAVIVTRGLMRDLIEVLDQPAEPGSCTCPPHPNPEYSTPGDWDPACTVHQPPLLGTRPQPTLDAEASIEEAARVIARHAAFGLKWDELTEPVQDFWRSAARATLTAASLLPGALDREAVEDAIRDELLPSLGLEIANPLSVEAAAAVMALVRPLPTREQIAEALHREKHSETCMFNNPSNCDQFRQSIQEAEALNLLFSGGEE